MSSVRLLVPRLALSLCALLSLAACERVDEFLSQGRTASAQAGAEKSGDPGTHAPAPVRAGDRAAAAPPEVAVAADPQPVDEDDELVAFQGMVATQAASPATCAMPGFTPPANLRVFAAGSYSGRKLDYQIDQSGHQATRIDVAVNHAGPVALMLGAYEPTVWNLGWSKRTRIVAVLVSGYHRQAVAGLPRNVPVLNSSHDNKGPCGYFHVAENKVQALNPIARQVFGKSVDMVYLANDGSALIGDPLPASELITSSRVAPDSFRDPGAPLAGPAGLQDAVRRGLLREATSADLLAWREAQRATARDQGPPIANPASRRSGPDAGIHNGYVVLKAMRLPAGLYGAHLATFIVPKGVPRPTGDPGHSAIYDYNTMACTGAICRMQE